MCSGDHLTHLCPKIEDAQCLLGQQGTSSSQAVLTNPFPQGHQLLASASSNPGTSAGGNQEGEKSSNVFMMGSNVHVATRSCDYGEAKTSKDKTVPRSTDLHIERPPVETIPRITKGSAKRATINPNARATQNYSIVEDLAQIPCTISSLEVLQSCLAQQSSLLSVIGIVDPSNSLVLTFNMLNVKKLLLHHMDFQINFTY